MDIQLILLLLIVVIVAVIVGNIISSIIQKKNSIDQLSKSDLTEETNTITKNLIEEFKKSLDPLKTELTTNKTIIEQKAKNIQDAHDKLVNSLTGSSRFGATGQLLLEHLFKNSGLVEKSHWIKNQTYKKRWNFIKC